MIWDPDLYYFYIDGVLKWQTVGGGVCNQPGYVKITGEISTEAWAITSDWSLDPAPMPYPDYFLVDWVRVYSTTPPPAAEEFVTGFETGDTQPTWINTLDGSFNVGPYTGAPYPECEVRQEAAHLGTQALVYSGNDQSKAKSYCKYKVFDVNFAITSATKMSYWIYPQQANGRYVAVDYVCTDGTTLRDSGAVDYNGISMHPKYGHGGAIPLNAWTQIKCNVGQWLNGKTIDRIIVNYDQPPNTGDYRGYIDDILITTGTLP